MEVPGIVRPMALAIPGVLICVHILQHRPCTGDFQERHRSQMLSQWVRGAHHPTCHARWGQRIPNAWSPFAALGCSQRALGHGGKRVSATRPQLAISPHTNRQICPRSGGAALSCPADSASICNSSIWIQISRVDILPPFFHFIGLHVPVPFFWENVGCFVILRWYWYGSADVLV